jgi:A/G-specific adenine glycosylase
MPGLNDDKRNWHFTTMLLKWNRQSNTRTMPWKGEKDPYKIWLSEIILQQTRVEQGWDYYNRFIAAFPTVQQLAKAPENKVFKLWEGLGYYSRCKNLIVTAKKITEEYNGVFPHSYEDILQLKGVGPYTAAAIASFAFNSPYAVVDGNVFRVLARYFNNDTAIDSTAGKKIFTELAGILLDKKQPGLYNQAIMDFGAVICKPQQPLCSNCVLNKNCLAYAGDRASQLPVKEKKLTVKNRWFYYVIAQHKNDVLIKKRTAGDIWENLYEFVLYEAVSALDNSAVKNLTAVKNLSGTKQPVINWVSSAYKQKLTHQTIYGQFINITLSKKTTPEGCHWVPFSQLSKLAFPKIITLYLKDKNVSLNLM